MSIVKPVILFLAVLVSIPSLFARDFFLGNPRTSSVSGPFQLESGTRCRLSGRPYEIIVHNDGRFSLKSLSDGTRFGPFQTVDNRLISVNSEIYCFNWNAASARSALQSGAVRKSEAERAYEADSKPVTVTGLTAEPARPKRLAAPNETPPRHVPAKDLVHLPEPEESFSGNIWFAPHYTTPVKWKINSKRGKQSDIERLCGGGDIGWNSWKAQLSVSPSVKSGGIVPTDDGSASIDDGTGWSLALGYNRPFLFESGWSANAGLRGMLRKDKGTLSSSSFVADSQADTNGVYSVSKKKASTSVSMTELSLWVDLGLSYTYEDWCLYSEFSFQPFSDYSVSGNLSYAGEEMSLEAERASPVAFRIGGWYVYDQMRIFADVTLSSDTIFRIGCGFSF